MVGDHTGGFRMAHPCRLRITFREKKDWARDPLSHSKPFPPLEMHAALVPENYDLVNSTLAGMSRPGCEQFGGFIGWLGGMLWGPTETLSLIGSCNYHNQRMWAHTP